MLYNGPIPVTVFGWKCGPVTIFILSFCWWRINILYWWKYNLFNVTSQRVGDTAGWSRGGRWGRGGGRGNHLKGQGSSQRPTCCLRQEKLVRRGGKMPQKESWHQSRMYHLIYEESNNKKRWNSLIWACCLGLTKMVKLLIAKKAALQYLEVKP